MSDEITVLRIPGLTRLERLELEQHLGPEAVEFEEQPATNTGLGEPLTITAIVVVSVAVIQALAVWLAKSRTGESLERTVEIVHPGGAVERHIIRYQGTTSSAPDEDALKQLASIFDLDISSFLDSDLQQ